MSDHIPKLSQKSAVSRYLSSGKRQSLDQVLRTCKDLTEPPGIHSTILMSASGFQYTGSRDTARCNSCGLQISDWKSDMKPFAVHEQARPTCSFVQSRRPTAVSAISTIDDQGRPAKRMKTETSSASCSSNELVETDITKSIRQQTFSHWPPRKSPTGAQMTEAGFFCCNILDRVICIYCDLVCQEWAADIDDPYEVHRIISPKCPYVIAMLKCQQNSVTFSLTVTESSENETEVIGRDFYDPLARQDSFAGWPTGKAPSVESLVLAGFVYRNKDTTVTCFSCKGSLNNWGKRDNPMVEHARWFPQCRYAKDMCGDGLYKNIQMQEQHQKHLGNTNTDSLDKIVSFILL